MGPRSGESIATIGYEAWLVDPESAWARLRYTVDGTPEDYRVWLEASPCHFGGFRWWWVCPISGRRAAKLYLPLGATVFGARETYRLAHRSQRETPLGRMHFRQARLYRKLGAEYHHYGQVLPPRPKGMHCKTYERLEAEIQGAMDAHESIAGVSAILK